MKFYVSKIPFALKVFKASWHKLKEKVLEFSYSLIGCNLNKKNKQRNLEYLHNVQIELSGNSTVQKVYFFYEQS